MVWKRCVYAAALTLLLAVSFTLPAFGDEPALIRAAEKGNFREVRALLSKGANVNARDKDGITALMMAASGGHLEVVRVLLAHGADVNAKVNNAQTGGSDWTALSWASGHHPEVVLELLDKGADISAGWSFPGTEEQADVDRANAEINRVYKHLMSTLDPQQQKVLREEERAWIKWRDAEADRIARSTSSGGSAYRVDYLDAMLNLIKQRTAILKDYRTPAKVRKPGTSQVLISKGTSTPRTVRPGGSVQIDTDYSLLMPVATAAQGADVQESFTLKKDGKVLTTSAPKTFHRASGGWVASRNLPIPPNAEPGTYVVEHKVQVGTSYDTDESVFVVEP